MSLALFDLDNTLLGGDSDYAWGQFLVEKGVVDAAEYAAANQRFYRLYQAGQLDIHEFAAFAFRPLKENSLEQLHDWRAEFIETKIRPIMLPKGQAKLEEHRHAGDILVIITATNSFVTKPIAEAFGVEHLIATEPEFVDGAFTGRIAGTPCFQQGKVARLQQWLGDDLHLLAQSHFYSDSHNDIPLLQQVTHPVAVDPDAELRKTAIEQQWPVISFRD